MAYDPNAPIPNDPYGRTPANFGFQTAINPQTGQEQFFLPASEIANISSQFGQGFIGDPSTWASQVQNADQEQGVYGTQDPLQYLQGLYRQTRDININPVLDPSTGGAFIDPATLGYAPRLDIGEKFPTGLKGALQFTGDVLTQTPIGTAALSAGLGALGEAGDITGGLTPEDYARGIVRGSETASLGEASVPQGPLPDVTEGVPPAPTVDTSTGTNWMDPSLYAPYTPTDIAQAAPQGFLDRLTSIQSLSDVGNLIKDYPQYAGAALGFLKSGNLMGAAAGYGLGSGIGNLAAGNYLSGGLQTGLGLLGLGATGSQGLLGGPLGKVFGGTAAPGAGVAGAGGAGAGGAGLPGTIRPYQFAQTRNPNWGKPGEPYFIQQYTAQPTYRAANGGQIPDLDNMYPQSSIDHSSYATPLQRPVQQAVVSSGYGPKLNPFTGEEQMAGGGLAGLGLDAPTFGAPDPDYDKMARGLSNNMVSQYATDADDPFLQAAATRELYRRQMQRPLKASYTKMADGGLADLTPTYAAGGRLLRGPGDGVSDSIPAVIGGKRPQRAALADGEFVLPARIVSEIGNGSTEAGARKLYAMMDRIQKRRGSTLKNVAADTRAEKLLPA